MTGPNAPSVADRIVGDSDMSLATHAAVAGGDTVLVLVDEIGSVGLPRRTRGLMTALATIVRPILVAQRYGRLPRRIGKVPWSEDFYAFSAQDYDAKVAVLAGDLVDRHRPAWVLAYGWENTQLIVELAERDVPIVMFADYLSAKPEAGAQFSWASFYADAILLPEAIRPAVGLAVRGEPFAASRKAPERVGFLERLLGPRDNGEEQLDLAKRLVGVGRQTVAERDVRVERMHHDAATIQAAGVFNRDLSSPRPPSGPRDEPAAILGYLRMAHRVLPRETGGDRDGAGPILRRPMAGFHPLVYATDRADFGGIETEDPLAHFLRNGRPSGRWTHAIIPAQAGAMPPAKVRTALHAHMHYPDLLPELLDRLSVNATQVDLFITTTSDSRRDEIAACLHRRGVKPAKLVSEPSNRGRDIWPFLVLLGSGAFASYDVVGHVHGKRSPTYDHGDVWRDFLWRHLVGRPEAMMDRILDGFARESRLGLVIAEDPHLESWAGNKTIASALAEKMGIALPLPAHFEFPIGTMFWARPEAMAPLLDLGLTPDMIPPEPLPADGTLLHALERLIPFAATRAGFDMAATHVPGCTR